MRALFYHTISASLDNDEPTSHLEEPAPLYTAIGIDPVFFNSAFKQLQSRLRYYAMSFVPSETAEDIIADVFCNWWKSGKSFDSIDHLRSYLFLAVKHQCFKWLEKQKRESAMIGNLSQAIAEEEYDVKETLLTKLEQEIARLPQKCKRIFTLAYFEQLPEKEIATQLQISPNTVRNQKARALQLLRLALRLLILFIFI